MSAVLPGLALALAASAALNGAYLLQHAGATVAPRVTPRRPLRTVRALLGRPVWVAGLTLGLAGWGLHVAALSAAPLSLVQAFVAGGLVLAVPVAVGVLGHRLASGERIAVCAMGLALVALSVGAAAPRGGEHVHAPALAADLASVLAVAGGLAWAPRGRRRGLALGAAGGILYGEADLAIKAAVSAGIPLAACATVTTAATVAAFFCFQRALQLGPALPVIALMTAGTNVASIAGGLLVLGEPLGATPAIAVAHLLALILVAAAAWMLAPVQAALASPDGERRTKAMSDRAPAGGSSYGRLVARAGHR